MCSNFPFRRISERTPFRQRPMPGRLGLMILKQGWIANSPKRMRPPANPETLQPYNPSRQVSLGQYLGHIIIVGDGRSLE